jgi:hypothetical protein
VFLLDAVLLAGLGELVRRKLDSGRAAVEPEVAHGSVEDA